MATEKEPVCQNYCANDPNFAIICSFFDRFAVSCGISPPTFLELQEMLENPQDEVPLELIDLHVKLLRKIRKSVAMEKWERALIKFCHSYYCSDDGWELERCGYKKCKVPLRLRILKNLLDAQFDLNAKLKNDISKLTAEELRLEPLGKDKVGQSYWCQFDTAANVRVYKEDQDEETWKLVAKDREGLVELITQLSSGEELLDLELINEDSNSQEVEKPIIDTGQVEVSTSEDNTVDNSSSVDIKVSNSIKQEENSNSISSVHNGSCEETSESLIFRSDEQSCNNKKQTGNDKESTLIDKQVSDATDKSLHSDDYDNKLNNNAMVKTKSEQQNLTLPVNDAAKLEINTPASEKLKCTSETDIEKKEELVKNNITSKSETEQIDTVNSIDVAEEIKQRFAKTIKGKCGKLSSGSILDQIFSRKLEKTNVDCLLPKDSKSPVNVCNATDKLDNVLNNDESCSQSSFHSSEKEDDTNDINKKRKNEESDSLSIKKKCVETVPDESEVGEEIEEPVMIIEGEGSGQDCDTGNPGRDNEENESEKKLNVPSSNHDVGMSDKCNQMTLENCVENSHSEGNNIKNGDVINENNTTGEFFTKTSNSVENELSKSCSDLKSEDYGNDREATENSNLNHLTSTKSSECVTIEEKSKSENQNLLDEKESKSIEEQLSDLTGQSLSPNPDLQSLQNKGNLENDEISSNSLTTEKEVRKKSLDCTDSDVNDSLGPEAKKTRTLQDSLDIFGEESTPYSEEDQKNVTEEVKHLEKDSVICNNELTTCNTVSEKECLNIKKSKDVSNNSNIESEKCQDDPDTPLTGKDLVCQNKENSKNKEINLNSGKEIENSSNNTHDNKNVKLQNCKVNKDLTEKEYKLSNTDDNTKSKTLRKGKGKKESKAEFGKESNGNTSKESQSTLIPNNKKLVKESTEGEVNELKNVSENDETCEKNTNKTPLDGKKISSGVDERLNSASENKNNDSVSEDDENIMPNKKTPTKKHRKRVFTPKSRKKIVKNKVNDNVNVKSKDISKDNNSTELLIEEVDSSKEEKDKICTEELKPIKITNRKRRNSRKNTGTEKDTEEEHTSEKKDGEEDEVGGKRRKVKGKRAPNKSLRKSIEKKRNTKSSSEEENLQDEEEKSVKKSPGGLKQKTAKNLGPKKPLEKTKKVTSPSKVKKSSPESTKSPEEHVQSTKKKKAMKVQGRNSRAFMGIDLNININEASRSVRQSSRLAQIKIKEQADNKQVEEISKSFEKQGQKSRKKKEENEETHTSVKNKKHRHRHKVKVESEDDVPLKEEISEKKRRKTKHLKKPRFNERNPWKSSSGSSSEVEEEEEDHFEVEEEEERLPLELKSDHEFSPESDLEGDNEERPVRRARTAQILVEPAEDDEESKDVDDFACEKCSKKDHPEWILLCDTCNHGWHASCLRPSLMLVPEGDWHCPPCQHTVLVKKLQETLKIFDRDTKRRENEELRRKRLAYVGISLDNVLPCNAHQPRPKHGERSGSESSESGSESSSDSESQDSDEPVYQLRQRRTGTTSYRFNEYDDLINSAIQDEVAAVDPVVARSLASVNEEAKVDNASQSSENKPTTTGEETKAEDKALPNTKDGQSNKPKKEPKKEKDGSEEDSSEDNEDDEEEEEEFPSVVPKRPNILPRPGKKKHRRLNCLDDASDDDDGSDEDFKGSSSEGEEEEEDDEGDSDDSEIGRRGRSKRGHLGPVRRSSRTRKARFDKDFINDDSDESDAPRRKKTKKLWSDYSDSESEDSTWGRRKKKKSYGSSGRRKFKKNKKFMIEDELSDAGSSKAPKQKRQRKIKYGGLDELTVEDLPARRTRGKHINYQEVNVSDSEDDIQKPKSFKKNVIEDEDEFVFDKEEKEASATSSEGEENLEDEENSSESEKEDKDIKEVKKPKEEVKKPKQVRRNQDKDQINEENKDEKPKVTVPPVKVSPSKPISNNEAPMAKRRGRPPKAMIAPPPERLISEDEKYKAIVSKVPTLSTTNNDRFDCRSANSNINEQISSEDKHFMESAHHLGPVKGQSTALDAKLIIHRSPPIKIRSGVPVNAAGRRSPVHSPTSEGSFFSVKSPNSNPIHSPPDTFRRSMNPLVKSENITDEDIDEEDLMEDVEEDEEDESEDDPLEEGEIPKKVARRMAKLEDQMARIEEQKLAGLKPNVKSGGGGSAQAPSGGENEQKPDPPTTQPTQPLLRVVSPLKLMANPPGPLQSTFMHSGMNPRMPLSGQPAPSRMPIMRPPPPQPGNMMPVPGMAMGDSPDKRRSRGRGRKQLTPEKGDQEMMGGSVIRGMLQQPQSYPPTHYPQQFPPHPRIPYNPQRMPTRPQYPGHHPLDPSPSGGGTVTVKQEAGVHPPTNPIHIPNKQPANSAPYHPPLPQHRFDSGPPRHPNYPQGTPPSKPQYGSYPPSSSAGGNYHYGSYPPPLHPREDVYPVQQAYNEQFSEPSSEPPAPPPSKSFTEEESSEFGGLVSYFSSQREDDIDT